jgi:glycosyltransferase involved in cell wall biosynthesis
MKRVLLISNKVFHYRVSNYNYFAGRFREESWELFVRANEVQKNNPYPLEFDFLEMPFRFLDYKREIERLQPDVVIIFLHLKNLIIWPLIHWLKLKGIPVVYWNKGINLEVENPNWRNNLFYYVHNLSDAILLYGEHLVQHIQPRNRHKVFVANNAINATAFPEIRQSRREIKDEFNIPFEKVVLFVGQMRPMKKVEHLIEVFNGIDDPALGCVIVGDSKDYDMTRMIKTERIRYMGALFDTANLQVSKLFKMADVFCIPGDVGLGLNEAFHWGLPVVTEAVRQSPEINYLTPERNGFIVPENDIVALKSKLLLLLHDDALRAEFSRRAKADIESEASIERMFRGFRDCLDAIGSGELRKTAKLTSRKKCEGYVH